MTDTNGVDTPTIRLTPAEAHHDRMLALATAEYRRAGSNLTSLAMAGYREALRDVVAEFGDFDWPTGEPFALRLHRWAAREKGIDLETDR